MYVGGRKEGKRRRNCARKNKEEFGLSAAEAKTKLAGEKVVIHVIWSAVPIALLGVIK